MIPALPDNTLIEPIHKYAYELNLIGVRSELARNKDNLNLYTGGNAAVHPLYMVFSRITEEKPSRELIETMDFFLNHPLLAKDALNKYSSWYDPYGNQLSINPFGLFVLKTISHQDWYHIQFVECLKAGADVRYQFATTPLSGVRYRDFMLTAKDQTYSSAMIKFLTITKNIEPLVWKEKFDQSLLLRAVMLHKNDSLSLLLEAKIFNLDELDESGKTVLHYSVESKSDDTLITYALLLKSGADVNRESKDGKALDIFLRGYLHKDLTDEEKNLIWNMCILSIEYGYENLNQLHQLMTAIRMGQEYYLPIEEVFDDSN